MATREKKSKLNSNSPTPASESSSAPSTPTGKKTPLLLSATKPAKRRGRPSLAASATILDQENDDEQSTSEEPAKSKAGRVSRTTNKTTIDVKEEVISDSGIEVKKDVGSEFNTEIKKTSMMKTRGRGMRRGGLKRGIGTRATNVVKEGLVKRRAVPFLIKRGRGGRRRIATGRADAIKELVSDDKLVKTVVLTTKRGSGRPRKIVEQTKEKVQRKRRRLLTDLKDVEKNPVKIMKIEHSDGIVSDSELIKLRRRSESISKSSDTTDTLSMIDTSFKKEDSEIKEIENNNPDVDLKNIKEEVVDESDSSSQQKSDSKPLRRSGRPKKIKERDGSVTPKSKIKLEASTEEPTTIEEEIESDGKCTPLTIDTSAAKNSTSPAASNSGSVTEIDKASSLSPELISEGVNVISVKQFYGEPQFLENNLGIEKDPKLGEIVVHEKNKIVDESDKVVEAKVVDEKVVDKKVVEEKAVDVEIDTKIDERIVVDSKVVDNKIVDNKVVDNKVVDNKVVGNKIVDKKVVENEVDDKKVVETKVVDTKVVDTKVVNTKVVDSKIFDTKAIDSKVVDTKRVDKEIVDIKVVDIKIVDEKVVDVDENVVDTKVVNTKAVDTKVVDEKVVGEKVVDTKIADTKMVDTKVVINTKVVADLRIVDTIVDYEKEIDKIVVEVTENDKNREDLLGKIVQKILSEDKNSSEISKTQAEETKSTKETVISEVADLESTMDKNDSAKSEMGPLVYSESSDEADNGAKDELDEKTGESSDSTDGDKDSKNGSENMEIDGENLINETPESIKEKESHLKMLGLLTHEAKATIEKAKRSKGSSKTGEYTGTLKTVIKLHRAEKRKRLPLKMTFQKGRAKTSVGADKDLVTNSGGEDTYYTIQNEGDSLSEGSHGGHNRKSHNRYTDGTQISEVTEATGEKTEKALVIPEKASSFSIHPGRLCQDQCFYCGGKFGIFDTPLHIAQIKSLEKQKKILDSEEKLTVDNCLCDACYRHVDRRANCPSFRKRLSAPGTLENINRSITEHAGGELETDRGNVSDQQEHQLQQQNTMQSACCVIGCEQSASHNLRKKWFIKMRKSLNKLINIDFDPSGMSQAGFIQICDTHYDVISHLMICTFCKRKLPRNHIFYITQEIPKIEKILATQGLTIVLGSTPVVCKLCRYFANLLLKPPESKSSKAQFFKDYVKRLQSIEECTENLSKHPNSAVQSRKSSDATIGDDVENDYCGNNSPGQILLDNDVMVNYDLPILDGRNYNSKRSSKTSQQESALHNKSKNENDINSDMARVLRANPNISMRELFPGEEEMGLHASIPFHLGSHKTPEGWTKISTVVQYDDSTRHLWDELQKPYGNQSSFLRHLVLLEKYFRDGDLILSQNASSNAVNYSESVQNRLRSFDNIPTAGLNIMQQMNKTSISIIPTVSIIKPKSKPVETATTSLLKTNNFPNQRKSTPIEMISRQQQIFEAASKMIKSDETSILPATTVKPRETTKPDEKLEKIEQRSPNSIKNNQPNVIVLPDTLNADERKLINGKPWRPTLIPMTSAPQHSQSTQLYQTADGRRLPPLVQVQSGGKPYHISIYDYNRMCILRREKLILGQQLQQKNQRNTQDILKKLNQKKLQQQNSQKVQIPNKILEQNSIIPVSSKPSETTTPVKRKSNGGSTSLLKPPQHVVPIAPKPPKLPTCTSLVVMPTTSATSTVTTGAAAPGQWMWSENLNGKNCGGSILLDNSAASVLSKIPKSLTVIPQQKSGSRSSGEEQNLI